MRFVDVTYYCPDCGGGRWLRTAAPIDYDTQGRALAIIRWTCRGCGRVDQQTREDAAGLMLPVTTKPAWRRNGERAA